MQQLGTLIKTRKIDFSQVAGDKKVFMRIVEDMRQNGGNLAPSLNWILADADAPTTGDSERYIQEAFSESGFEHKFSTMDKMLAPWLGGSNAQLIDDQARKRYEPLLAQYDPLGLWRANVENQAVASSLMFADLGSIMDLNLLYSFAPTGQREKTMILEVGGGYGRLAEAAFNVFGDSIRYVLVDSVPGSLYYAKIYLEAACPEIRVGSYYCDDEFDMDKFECYIAPSWHFAELNTASYDFCVNIESFQEMTQEHVDHYLCMFEAVAREEAIIYVSNARDYWFKGEWNYPKNWRKLLCTNTPRSWKRDHPTEIFEKLASNVDFSSENAILDAFHRYFLERGFEDTLLKTRPREAARPIARYFSGPLVYAVQRRSMNLYQRVEKRFDRPEAKRNG